MAAVTWVYLTWHIYILTNKFRCKTFQEPWELIENVRSVESSKMTAFSFISPRKWFEIESKHLETCVLWWNDIFFLLGVFRKVGDGCSARGLGRTFSIRESMGTPDQLVQAVRTTLVPDAYIARISDKRII